MMQTANLPERYDALVSSLDGQGIVPRIWAHDYTVWKPTPAEIANRLGWLHVPFSAMDGLDRLHAFAESVRSDGLRHVLLLGMGGSSLAAQTISLALGTAPGFLDLTVLDSTHPEAVLAVEERLDLARTLFLVATKSGTTPETLALFRHFFHRVRERAATAEPGTRFVAITDPGSPLVALASEHRFREAFLSDADVGGRYSALTAFGLVPAALLGVDLARLFGHAQRMAVACARPGGASENPAARLGAILGAAALDGRDKATFFFSPGLESFGPWLEQLIAESTGKEGTGVVPVVGEPIGAPEAYASDRVFVRLSLGGRDEEEDELSPFERTGSPVVRIQIKDAYGVAGQFFLWELATAVVGHALKVNPFDQPNVEAAKALARDAAEAFRRPGSPPALGAAQLDADALLAALTGLRPGDYVALQAFLPPIEGLSEAFSWLRATLRDRFRVATTFGYGPRFLHSTGQLHKGGRGNGRFIQFVSDPERDVRIPDEATGRGPSLSFGELIAAQAAGDRQALVDAGRQVSTFAVPADPTDWIRRIASELGRAAPETRQRRAAS